MRRCTLSPAALLIIGLLSATTPARGEAPTPTPDPPGPGARRDADPLLAVGLLLTPLGVTGLAAGGHILRTAGPDGRPMGMQFLGAGVGTTPVALMALATGMHRSIDPGAAPSNGYLVAGTWLTGAGFGLLGFGLGRAASDQADENKGRIVMPAVIGGAAGLAGLAVGSYGLAIEETAQAAEPESKGMVYGGMTLATLSMVGLTWGSYACPASFQSRHPSPFIFYCLLPMLPTAGAIAGAAVLWVKGAKGREEAAPLVSIGPGGVQLSGRW